MHKDLNEITTGVNLSAAGSDQAASPSSSIARIKDAYKEIIGLSKDTLDVAWKIAPLALMPAALLLWSHLNVIGWTELFQESAMSGGGLIFLFSTAALIAIAVAFQVIVPSIFMLMGLSFYEYEKPIPQGIMALYLWTLLGWLGGLALIIAFDFTDGWPVAALTISVALTLAFAKREHLKGEKEVRTIWLMARIVGASLMASITMLGTCVPLLLAIRFLAQYEEVGVWAKIFAFFICAAASVVSLLPGFAYLQGRTKHAGIHQPLKITVVGFLISMYVLFSVAIYFAPVSSTILRLAGVFSNEPQTFQVLQPTLADAISVVGLPTNTSGNGIFVSAYRRYSFGGTLLLCRSRYDERASKSSISTRDERVKANEAARIAAGSHCVRALANEVRPLRG
ncbi:hypothetical protein [Cupriavidus sp. TMH.W2]|uniref:hypothetical protein n=1 Tax=Cupriavidus sp. TMH.W2 TaxID=3434465 RepID=UPI003D78666E